MLKRILFLLLLIGITGTACKKEAAEDMGHEDHSHEEGDNHADEH